MVTIVASLGRWNGMRFCWAQLQKPAGTFNGSHDALCSRRIMASGQQVPRLAPAFEGLGSLAGLSYLYGVLNIEGIKLDD